MSNIQIVLPGTELDLTASPWLGQYKAVEIYVDGIVGTYTAQSLYEADADIAVSGTYVANDGSCVPNMPVYAVGDFNKIYNSTAGANLRVQLESK